MLLVQGVKEQGWSGCLHAPTTHQVCRSSRPAGRFAENTLLVDVEETISEFRDLVNTLSKFTHVGPTTFNIDGADADDLAKQALDIFIMLFDTIDECRNQVRAEMEDHVKNAVNDELLETTVQELHEIATHH
jgi:hypothetical protein